MKPVILPLDPMTIPAEQRDIPAWIGWRPVQRDGRWSKEPITIQNGVLAETDNPATWCNFQTAVEGYKRLGCDGIGMCRNGDLVFLDLDGVLDLAGEAEAVLMGVEDPFDRRGTRLYREIRDRNGNTRNLPRQLAGRPPSVRFARCRTHRFRVLR
jgi:hypothetical protein